MACRIVSGERTCGAIWGLRGSAAPPSLRGWSFYSPPFFLYLGSPGLGASIRDARRASPVAAVFRQVVRIGAEIGFLIVIFILIPLGADSEKSRIKRTIKIKTEPFDRIAILFQRQFPQRSSRVPVGAGGFGQLKIEN